MGLDTLEPHLSAARARGAGILILVRTSNPGAADVMDVELARGGTLWEHVAGIVDGLGQGEPIADVGAVVGATAPWHIGRMRELMPRTPFLLPGIGAQGGTVDDARRRVCARARRWSRQRVALDRQRGRRSRRRRSGPRGPRGGRASARRRMGACVRRSVALASVRWPRAQGPGPHIRDPGDRRLRGGDLLGGQLEPAQERRLATGHDDVEEAHHDDDARPSHAVRGQAGRHAVADRPGPSRHGHARSRS